MGADGLSPRHLPSSLSIQGFLPSLRFLEGTVPSNASLTDGPQETLPEARFPSMLAATAQPFQDLSSLVPWPLWPQGSFQSPPKATSRAAGTRCMECFGLGVEMPLATEPLRETRDRVEHWHWGPPPACCPARPFRVPTSEYQSPAPCRPVCWPLLLADAHMHPGRHSPVPNRNPLQALGDREGTSLHAVI